MELGGMVQAKSLHHFVPRSYLRAFADVNGDLLTVLRSPYEVRRTNVATVAAERHFYKLRRSDGSLTDELEDELAEFDASIPRVVGRASGDEEITDEDALALKTIYAVMVARGPVGRDFIVSEVEEAIGRLDRDFEASFPEEDSTTRQHYVGRVIRGLFGHREDLSADAQTVSRANVMPLAKDILAAMPTHVCVVRSMVWDFISSDAPYSAFNSAGPPRADGYYDPDMSSPTVELTLPLGRRHLAIFANKRLPRRAKCYDGVVRIANGRTAFYAKRMVFAYPSEDAEANALAVAQLITYKTAYLEPLLPGFNTLS